MKHFFNFISAFLRILLRSKDIAEFMLKLFQKLFVANVLDFLIKIYKNENRSTITR